MFKSSLGIAAVVAALIAPPVFAQSDVQGESKAAPSKPSTKEEKKAAKEKRRATGKEVGKHDHGRVDHPTKGTAAKKPATAEEKEAGRASRQAAGKEASKQGSGRLDDVPATR